jgi:hypothetical protein
VNRSIEAYARADEAFWPKFLAFSFSQKVCRRLFTSKIVVHFTREARNVGLRIRSAD